MIQPLRQKHCSIFIGLLFILSVILAAGLWSRKPVPIAASIPDVLLNSSFEKTVVNLKQKTFTTSDLIIILFFDSFGAPPRGFSIKTVKHLKYPDILVYWRGHMDSSVVDLPVDSYFLGTISGNEMNFFALPKGQSGWGEIILYSLATHEIIESIALKN